jgi:hypothetical protein
MNDHHAMAVPLTVGIAWSGSESGKLVDLTADERVVGSTRRSRHNRCRLERERLGGLASRQGGSATLPEEDPVDVEWF